MDERYVGGLWCREVLGHLDAFIDGELDASTLAAVQLHVAACDACAAFGGAYARLVASLRAEPDVPLSDEALARLRRRVDLTP